MWEEQSQLRKWFYSGPRPCQEPASGKGGGSWLHVEITSVMWWAMETAVTSRNYRTTEASDLVLPVPRRVITGVAILHIPGRVTTRAVAQPA